MKGCIRGGIDVQSSAAGRTTQGKGSAITDLRGREGADTRHARRGREVTEVACAGFEIGVIQDGVDIVAAVQFLITRGEEGEAKGRGWFECGDKAGSEVLLNVGEGHEQQGSPACAEQVFERG